MDIFHIILLLTTLLCSLVSGFLFAFAVVVMPGIKKLNDEKFIEAFQAMDGIIQSGHPLFGLAWVGSALGLLVSAVLGFSELDETGWYLLISTTLIFFLGVQLPTIAFNIPLNNQLQSLEVGEADQQSLRAARHQFETPWNRWNIIRTILSVVTTALLILLLIT